ncbi:MAG: tetratricopeptide repeat protein [Proteobacteria bacterium]|nr:tetratricopeptide repeat protein [Pseudomonadota bacterium]
MLIKYVMAFVMSLVLVSAVMAAGSSSSSSSSTQRKSVDYENGVKAVNSADYIKAIKLLSKVVAAKPKDADAWNYLGFSNRKLKRFDQALDAYQKALAINPKHRGAHEYLGELYLQTDDLANARKHLKRLDKICFFGCDEYDDLKAAILAYENQ